MLGMVTAVRDVAVDSVCTAPTAPGTGGQTMSRTSDRPSTTPGLAHVSVVATVTVVASVFAAVLPVVATAQGIGDTVAVRARIDDAGFPARGLRAA